MNFFYFLKMSFDQDFEEFKQKHIKGQTKKFNITKQKLLRMYPDVFGRTRDKSFIYKDTPKAKEILQNYYIPNNNQIKMYNYQNNGYNINVIYTKKQPRPFNVLQEYFDKNEAIQQQLNNLDEPLNKKIKYLIELVPDDFKQFDYRKLYQMIYHYLS